MVWKSKYDPVWLILIGLLPAVIALLAGLFLPVIIGISQNWLLFSLLVFCVLCVIVLIWRLRKVKNKNRQ